MPVAHRRPACALAASLTALVLAACLGSPEPVADPPPFVGIVTASHAEAVAAGTLMLEQGGNAIDAAAAVQFALNVVEPMMSGIGGGAFLLIWNQETQTLTALDGREVAPAAATPDMFQTATLSGDHVAPRERGIAVGVPGTLAVWDLALREHGTMDLATVIAPGIELANDGFVVNEVTTGHIEWSIDKVRRSPSAAELFLDGVVCPPQPASQVAAGDEVFLLSCEGGTALAPGTVLRQPALGTALAAISADGPDSFYGGPLGEALIEAQAARGGRMTLDDLTAYEVVQREPLLRTWRDHTVATFGLPSGGLVLQQALAILEPLEVSPRIAPTAAHNAIEAIHLAFADRETYYSDPETALADAEDILDPAFIAERRALIALDRTGAPYRAGAIDSVDAGNRESPGPSGHHTTHFTVMDQDGNIVAVTSTIESIFGSGIFVPEYGFFLNNEMTDFDLEPGGPNEVGPVKRPLSSMTPTIVFDEHGPLLALGSPGGYTIHGTVLQVMLDVLAGGTPIQDAVDAPRWAAGRSAQLLHDASMDADLLKGLDARGHELADAGRAIGGVHAIHRSGDAWVAAADPRGSGAVGSL